MTPTGLVAAAVAEWTRAVSAREQTRGWLRKREGRLYTRYNPHLDRVDIASIELRPTYRGRGVLKHLLMAAMALPVSAVRLECIQVPRLAASAKSWTFPGWSARSDGPDDGPVLCLTVTWTRLTLNTV